MDISDKISAYRCEISAKSRFFLSLSTASNWFSLKMWLICYCFLERVWEILGEKCKSFISREKCCHLHVVVQKIHFWNLDTKSSARFSKTSRFGSWSLFRDLMTEVANVRQTFSILMASVLSCVKELFSPSELAEKLSKSSGIGLLSKARVEIQMLCKGT